MRVEKCELITDWRHVFDLALTTQGKKAKSHAVVEKFKRNILRCEHSPIRALMFRWEWVDLPYWVSVHICRHKVGIEHFVSTQRTDRTGVNRDDLPQGALVRHACIANAQALINISRVRLCNKASTETREAWQMLKNEILKVEPIMAEFMVPNCVYRGECVEIVKC